MYDYNNGFAISSSMVCKNNIKNKYMTYYNCRYKLVFNTVPIGSSGWVISFKYGIIFTINRFKLQSIYHPVTIAMNHDLVIQVFAAKLGSYNHKTKQHPIVPC
jgi:hypothetical protein